MNVNYNFNQECKSVGVSTETFKSLDLSILDTSLLLKITHIGATVALAAGVVGFVAAAALAHMPALFAATAVCALAALTIYVIDGHQCGKVIRQCASITKLFEDQIKSKDKEITNKDTDLKNKDTELKGKETEYTLLKEKHDELYQQLLDANLKYEELKNGQSHKLLNDKCIELKKKLQKANEDLKTKSKELEQAKFEFEYSTATFEKDQKVLSSHYDKKTQALLNAITVLNSEKLKLASTIGNLNNEIESQNKKNLEQTVKNLALSGEVEKLSDEKNGLLEQIEEQKEKIDGLTATPNGKAKGSIIDSRKQTKESENILNASRKLFEDLHSSDEEISIRGENKDNKPTTPVDESSSDEASDPKTPVKEEINHDE